jgi:hypothetical protein
VQTVTSGSAQLQGGVYPNGADTTYWWEYGSTNAYGQQTLATDIGAGASPVSLTGSLPNLMPATTYHYRLVAENSFGTEYGYDYTLTTPASTTSSPNPGGGQNPPPTPSPPTATTPGSASGGGSGSAGTWPISAPAITNMYVGAAATSATVSATIATGGAATTYALQYGTTRSLGKAFSQSSSATTIASWTVRNLAPGKVYYFRVVASNAGGSAATAMVRFKTSPVTISRITPSGNVLDVVLRCHGSAPCHVRLQGRSGARLLLSTQATIRGNRSTTITLRLSKSFRTLATRGKTAKLLVLSTWNGATAMVSGPL